MAPKMKLVYFEGPGRAEAIRIILRLAGVDFEDVSIPFDKWPELKPSTPFGQLPVLEVDGKQLAQSGAIARYAALLASQHLGRPFYPTDPWAVAKTEEVYGLMIDMIDLWNPTWKIQDKEERAKANQAIVAGPLKEKLEQLAGLLAANGNTGYLVGDQLSFADVFAFATLGGFECGYIEGVPTTLLDMVPALRAFHTRVASLPEIASQYAAADGLWKAFQPRHAAAK